MNRYINLIIYYIVRTYVFLFRFVFQKISERNKGGKSQSQSMNYYKIPLQ